MPGIFEIIFPLVLTHDSSFTITFSLQEGGMLEFGGGVYYLYGDNGSGKTTFLNMLALTAGCVGNKTNDKKGTIKFNGKAYNESRFNHIKAAEMREGNFCIFPQKAFFLPVSTRDNYMVLNGSDKKKEASFSSQEYPDFLSGGQQQKILMDIVLDEKKAVWFLDEPLANLDAERRHYFWTTLNSAYRKKLSTVFFIDHWMGERIMSDKNFQHYNTLNVFSENRQKNRPPETARKQIEIYANNEPQEFFVRQIQEAEKEKTAKQENRQDLLKRVKV